MKPDCSFTPPGPSLEEKLFSSCDLTADKTAHVSFKPRQSLAQIAPRAKVSSQFHASPKARNWAAAAEDLSSAFVVKRLQEAPASPAGPPAHSSSESGEIHACLLDSIAAASPLGFASELTNNPGFLLSWGKRFRSNF